LLLSDTASVPFVFGIWQPQIVFPAVVLTMKHSAALRLMLAHEMAHVKRRDLFWSWLLSVTETLFFFHPLVWLARRESRLVQEMACDDLALRATSAQPADFGHMLLAIITNDGDHPRVLRSVSVGIFETKQSLERRIKQMKTIRSGRTAAAVGTLLVCTALALMVPWRLVAQKTPKTPESELEPKAEESAVAGQSTPTENELLQKEVELLRKEIELAARHVQAEQELLEAGRTTPQELLDRQRELLLLRRELASLERDPAAQEQAIRDALVETAKVLRAQKKRVELGASPPTSQLGFEREVVRLERELRGLSRSLAERTNAAPSSKPITSEGLRQTMVPTSVSGVVTKVMVQPGAKVKKGDPLIQFDDREAKVKFEAALSQVAAAEATLKLAELDVELTLAEYRKQKELFEQKLISDSPPEARGPRGAEARLAKNRADVKFAQAQADLARLALESLTVRAPHDGTVSRILAAEGQYVATLGRLLVEIVQ
jgi:biotin carboxyl carrier protein